MMLTFPETPMTFQVRVRGADGTYEGDRAFQFNRAMHVLYDMGCRRIRAASRKLVRDDGEYYTLLGWAR